MEVGGNPGRPRFSVVMAAFNVERFLDETVESLRAQTCRDWELVVVDDGSTDRTPRMLADWSSRDSRIRVFSQENQGRPAFGRNRGIREARGDIITFLDGDDLYHPEKLARQLEILEAFPDVGGVFHDYYWFQSGREMPAQGYLRYLRYLEQASDFFDVVRLGEQTVHLGAADLFKFMMSGLIGIHTSTIAVRREVLDRIGSAPFSEALPHAEDIHLWWRIGLATQLAYLDQALSYYRYHAYSWKMSTARAKIARGLYEANGEMLTRLEAILEPEERPRYAETVANRWYRIGRSCIVGGLHSEARRAMLKALVRTRRPGQAYLAVKGLFSTLLPRTLLRLHWRHTGEAEFAPRPHPPEVQF